MKIASSQIESARYIWDLVRPVLVLAITLLVFQLCGFVVGFIIEPVGFLPIDLWYGAAFASPLGFLIGIVFQSFSRPGTLVNNKMVVLFMGTMSLILPISGFFMYDFLVSEFGY